MIDEKKLIEGLKKHFDALYKEDGTLLQSDHICISEDVEDLIKFIEQQPKTDWIPCEERLPSEEMEVWVTHENGKVLRHYWFNGKFVQNYPLDEPRPYPEAIAWMPCIKPQPYKKEGAENE